jgi:hypothetical protein
MANHVRTLATACVALTMAASQAWAQEAGTPADTRAGRLAAQQQEKAKELKPYAPNKAELWVKKVEEQLFGGALHWHPFFTSAYRGGGFTLGAGYIDHVGDYNTIDVRGSWTPAGYLRAETEFRAPRLFDRRGTLSLVGGWREATQVGFFGIGTAETSADDEANYSFRQPYGIATLDVRPTRGAFLLLGGVEYSRWEQRPGEGTSPSVETVYTPETLTGLGATTTYLHTLGTVGIDTRPSAGYARRGGAYGITGHSFADVDDIYSFRQVDYDAIQHVPLGRDAWVLSLHARAETTFTGDDQQIPFFMLPALGGGSDLRGFGSWRFRDRHSLLFQAEWRVLVNSFFDTAVFWDAGKVVARTRDLDFDGLKQDYGLGFRLHGPFATPLRIDLAKSNEGFAMIFSSSAVF